LKALSRPQVAEFLREAFPWPDLPQEHPLVNALWQHSGGNAHYLQESLAYLKQSGIVENDGEDGWIVDTASLMEVGATSIQLLLERRVQQLDPLVHEVLEQAACYGVEFSEQAVPELFKGRASAAAGALATARAQGLLTQVKPGILTFQPYALWELIDAALPPDRRQRYHLQVAEYLQAGGGDAEDEQTALAIAKHWELGGDPLQALEYSLLAAERALANRANEQALEACRRAQQLVSGPAKSHPEAPKLTAMNYLHQAKAYRYLGDQAAQEEYAYKAYEAAVVSRNQQLELRALKALGEYYRSVADYEASTDYFRQGMEIAEAIGDRARIGRFHKEIGVNHYLQGELAQAQADYGRAIEINQEIDDAEGLARVYNNLGIICRNRGEWIQAKEYFERSIAYFQQAGETRSVVLPMGNMAIIYTEEGEYEKAMILLKELLKDEKQLGESRLQAKVRVTLGDVQFEIGQHDEALENYEHSLTVYRALGDRQGECEVLTNIASVYYEEG
ncbi:MAG TPA: tetratricopeptide repeat protein, partial [bacterium]|nr:tetratricopeptide repeat protein [bacterium]